MMQGKPINRRRALTIIAAAGIFPTKAAASDAREKVTWRGSVMGAEAAMTFYASSRDQAEQAVTLCLAEIDRLENVFSLYRAQSEICELNRRGRIAAPSQDLRRLLALSRHIGELTGGAFDPTVQALWRFYADWFTANPDAKSPEAKDLAPLRARVNYRRISLDNAQIRLGPEQEITLNGIAQGYITDRVAELLRAEGWRNVLLNLGEYRALERKPGGAPFRIGLSGSVETVPLADMALATSASAGFIFPGQSARASHLFDPKTGRSPTQWATIHVRHPSAALADGLSTAFCSMNAKEIALTIKKLPGTSLWMQSVTSGKLQHLQRPI